MSLRLSCRNAIYTDYNVFKSQLTRVCRAGLYELAEYLICKCKVAATGEALCEAIWKKHYNIAIFLIKHGANTHYSDRALNFACIDGHYDIVKLILDHGYTRYTPYTPYISYKYGANHGNQMGAL